MCLDLTFVAVARHHAKMVKENVSQKKHASSLKNLLGPATVFVFSLAIFATVSGDRLQSHSFDNHYVYLADCLLHGRLHLEGNPPHLNDWAKYNGKWFVSFPPAPGVLMIPGVAIFGLEFNDTLFTLFFSALGPALLLILLQRLRRMGLLQRKPWEIYAIAVIYAFGTVYFFCAVQGSVWYTAHMVGCVFLILYVISSLEGKHPVLAGLCLGLAAACRPTFLFAFPFFLYEILKGTPTPEGEVSPSKSWLGQATVNLASKSSLIKLVQFGLPIAIVVASLMYMNWARFDNPLEFGHNHLQVRWSGRIAKWGLFHYHYLSRNLAVALTLLPWLSNEPPYLGISTHGLAIWVTTPMLLYVLWPKTRDRFYTALAVTAIAVALPNLFYQNSGWVQFGYRFSLDYMVFLMVMLAATQRKFGKLFIALCIFSFAINTFGAITFNRHKAYYPSISTRTYFQPD